MYISSYAGVVSVLAWKPIPVVVPAGDPSAYANNAVAVSELTSIDVYAPAVPAVPTLLTPAVYSVPDPLVPSASSEENFSG